MDKNGTAIMVPGQYKGAYTIGIHGRTWASGGYKALEQKAPMVYVRDNSKDERLDFELYRNPELFKNNRIVANLKTNIHRASKLESVPLIGRYSAGCQVFQKPEEFNEFLSLCEIAARQYGNSFTYTLIEERDL
jgi:hypothetical protein